MEDLHIIFVADAVNVDVPLMNDVNLALLNAEVEIDTAIKRHTARLETFSAQYGKPNISVD